MTLSELPDGTHQFTPAASSGIDSYGIQRPASAAPIQGALRPANWHVYPARDDRGKVIPDLYGFDFTLDEFRGGIWKKESGTFDKTYCFLLESTGESRFEGYFTNPLDAVNEANIAAGANDFCLHHCTFAGKLVLAYPDFTGPTATVLLAENPSTGVPALLNYAKASGHEITGVTPIKFGTTTYLAVLQYGSVVELLTDLASTPTSAGTMHANSSGCWWMVNTDLPDTAIVAACGFNIYAWPRTAAIGDAPTLVESSVMAGGFLIGLLSLNAGVNRIYYVRPPDGANLSAAQPGVQLGAGASFYGNIYSRNQRGADEQNHTARWGLTNVTWAIPVRGGICASDSYQAKWNNGLTNKPLRIVANAPANSDIQRRLVGASSPDGESLFILVNEMAVVGGSTVTTIYWMRYDWDLDALSRVSEDITTAQTGMTSYQAGNGPGLPWSPFTRNLIEHHGPNSTGGPFYGKYEPPSDQNPYQLRHTTGSVAGTGALFNSTFRGRTPKFTFPGYEGADYWVGEIIGPPAQQIKNGGTGATLAVTVNDTAVTFSERAPLTSRPKGIRDAHDGWHPDLQVTIVGTNSTTMTDKERMAINALPIKVMGLLRMPKGFEVPANVDPR